MSKYTVRVELHDYADEHDYETLHAAMSREGFSRYIVDAAGTRYHLPLAEYNCDLEYDRNEVLDQVKRAAEKVGKRYSILVTKSAGRSWHGLKRG
jgi:hypothetical protein